MNSEQPLTHRDKPFLIIDLGSNHDGRYDRALSLMHQAAQAGADAVKFQLYRADVLARRRNLPESAWRTLKAGELPDAWLPLLAREADALGVEFMCTAYDLWGLQTVAPHVSRIKIASFELGDDALVSQAAQQGKPVILSTGMATAEEIRCAVHLLGSSLGCLLHCTSLYPTSTGQANVRRMVHLKRYTPLLGYSDHTATIDAALAAVVLGAEVVEMHMTDDHGRIGPDHGAHAKLPEEIARFAKSAGLMRRALGTGDIDPGPEERDARAHRSTGEPDTSYGMGLSAHQAGRNLAATIVETWRS